MAKRTNKTKPAATPLPDDFPGREVLLAASLDTVEKVAAHDDLSTIEGIDDELFDAIDSRLAQAPMVHPPLGKGADTAAKAGTALDVGRSRVVGANRLIAAIKASGTGENKIAPASDWVDRHLVQPLGAVDLQVAGEPDIAAQKAGAAELINAMVATKHWSDVTADKAREIVEAFN